MSSRIRLNGRYLRHSLDWARRHLPTIHAIPNRSVALNDERRFAARAWGPSRPLSESFDLILAWLTRAAAGGSPGFANSYHLYRGWQTPYAETTGYLLPTLIQVDSGRFEEVVHSSAEWLLKIQGRCGEFGSFHPVYGEHLLVFDAAQVVRGLVAVSSRFQDERYLKAACLSADWVISEQEPDGSFRRHAFGGIAHSYYALIGVPLLDLYEVTRDSRYRDAASLLLQWAAPLVGDDGTPAAASFLPSQAAFTHTVGYVLEGMIECGVRLHDSAAIAAAHRLAHALHRQFEKHGFLPGDFFNHWQTDASFTCLPGNAQIAMCWLRMAELGLSQNYVASATKLLHQNAATLPDSSTDPDLVGAIRASFPINGRYLPNHFPLWGAKYMIDASLCLERLRNVAVGVC